MSQSRFARAVGALAALSRCPGVLAEEPQRIEEVVVTGAREATPLAATPAAIGRLETRALDDAKATRIDQVINALPGVHMSGPRQRAAQHEHPPADHDQCGLPVP